MSIVKRITAISLLSAASFILNRFEIDLVFGLDFILGSIPVLFSAVIFGPLAGAATAAIGSIPTVILWNHFYAFPAFILEAVFIGILFKKTKWNLIAIDILYWVVIGIGVVLLSYSKIGTMGFENAIMIGLKQSINGVVNSVIVTMTFLLLQFLKPFKPKHYRILFNIENLLFTFISSFLIMALLVVLTYSSNKSERLFFDSLSERLSHAVTDIQTTFEIWADTYFNITEIISNYPINDGTKTAMEFFSNNNSDILSVYITDTTEKVILVVPEDSPNKDFISLRELDHTKSHMLSDTMIQINEIDKPTILFSTPRIDNSGIFKGWAVMQVKADSIFEHLLTFVSHIDQNFIIADGNYIVMDLSLPKNNKRIPLISLSEDLKVDGYEDLFIHYPEGSLPNLVRNRNAILFQKGNISDSNWNVVVSETSNSLYEMMFDINTTFLLIIMIFLLLTSITANLIIRRITKPLVSISEISNKLSKTPKNSAAVIWPATIINEINSVSGYIDKLHKAEQKLILELTDSNKNLTTTLMSISDGVIVTTADNKITIINQVAANLTGWSDKEAVGKLLNEVLILSDPLDQKTAKLAITSERDFFTLTSKTGKEYRIAGNSAPIMDEKKPIGSIIVFHDETESFIRENQLKQAQKMESIGMLAGGVAHDFNNLLTGIIGYADILESKLIDNPGLHKYCNGILDTSEKAANLIQQLLSFARKGNFTHHSLDIHDVITKSVNLLHIGESEHIEIIKKLEAQQSIVDGDEAMLQSMLLNLGVNARDAMTKGGTLTVTSENINLNDDDCVKSSFLLTPGEYILIKIKDTGTGIEEEVMDHIFEPFFTTKDVGQGVGLGLAAVYGTVLEMKGAVVAESNQRKGTIFKIFLPLKKSL